MYAVPKSKNGLCVYLLLFTFLQIFLQNEWLFPCESLFLRSVYVGKRVASF